MDHQTLARRTRGFGETVFSEITALAQRHGAVNLGQGFPDFDPPEFVLEAAREAAADPARQQYARSAGVPELVEILAEQLSPELWRELDPLAEVTITVGATEGLFVSIMALVDPGDEVILFEPFYDAYPADVALAGGVARYVPLQPDAAGIWGFDEAVLRRAFCDRTKLVILNTPHNPTGKVFDLIELELIAELCQRHGALCLCDEVYDRILFDGRTHRRMATIDGMWERTVTISSAGKTFSVTGWKIGWVVAPPALSTGIRRVHQWVPFAVATPLQRAVRAALATADERDYYPWLRRTYQEKRDRLVAGLRGAGLVPFLPEGTYFVVADVSSAQRPDEDDVGFCLRAAAELGVAAIPPSAFYCDDHKQLSRSHARFCFCKTDDTLDEAVERLSRCA